MPFTLDGPEVDTLLEYDPTRNALLGRENSYDGAPLSAFAYSVNEIGQRDGLTTSGDAFSTNLDWSWAYNARGELVQAHDQSAAGNDRAYKFDGIGNREKSVDGLIGDLPTIDNWAANSLNQYTTVDGYSPTPVHDDDGNMTSGPLPADPAATSTLVWDGENRIVSATVNGTTTTYAYDQLSRLISATTGGTTVRYLYDGWNRIAEYNGTTQTTAYLWGLDLSGTPQGAGGVGGLLSVSAIASGSVSGNFYPAYDGNGNVSEYVNAAGAVVAHFEYDPFGNLTANPQNNAALFPYRFSTKSQDATTGLYYYGYRFYDPVTGRWPSRDPISEDGGLNLYGFVGNEGISLYDYLGLKITKRSVEDYPIAPNPELPPGAGRVIAKISTVVTFGDGGPYNKHKAQNVKVPDGLEIIKAEGSSKGDFEDVKKHELVHVGIWVRYTNLLAEEINWLERKFCNPCYQLATNYGNATVELRTLQASIENHMFDVQDYTKRRRAREIFSMSRID